MKRRTIKRLNKLIISSVFVVAVAFSTNVKSYAWLGAVKDAALAIGGIATSIYYGGQSLVNGAKWTWDKTANFACNHGPLSNTEMCDDRNIDKHKGFKNFTEANGLLDKISNGTSDIKIYGQENAKSKCLPIAMNCLYNIHHEPEGEKTGNVVYIIGKTGTGKSSLARAIGESMLTDPKKTLLIIESNSINSKYSLADQLFGTVGKKSIGEKSKLFDGTDAGVHEIEKESKILEHILKWGKDGAVIVLDDYDRMKLRSNPDASIVNQYEDCVDGVCGYTAGKREDKTADEILKAIATTGKYTVSGTEVDCQKVLIMVTTNENRAELLKNFGVGGTKDAGVYKLPVIEFDPLRLEDCRKITIDMLNEVRTEVTDLSGEIKLKYFKVSDDTISKLTSIMESHILQGRLKKDLKIRILQPF